MKIDVWTNKKKSIAVSKAAEKAEKVYANIDLRPTWPAVKAAMILDSADTLLRALTAIRHKPFVEVQVRSYRFEYRKPFQLLFLSCLYYRPVARERGPGIMNVLVSRPAVIPHYIKIYNARYDGLITLAEFHTCVDTLERHIRIKKAHTNSRNPQRKGHPGQI